jgi:hypothetical protein
MSRAGSLVVERVAVAVPGERVAAFGGGVLASVEAVAVEVPPFGVESVPVVKPFAAPIPVAWRSASEVVEPVAVVKPSEAFASVIVAAPVALAL